MWLLARHGYAKRFGLRNNEGSSAFIGATKQSNITRLTRRKHDGARFQSHVSARQAIIAEIEDLPESVLVEPLHFIRFASWQRQEEWEDVLPGREVEQEVLEILDAP